MLSSKHTRIFVSLLTLVLCLGVLAIGARAEDPGPEESSQARAAEALAPSTESGPNPDVNIRIYKTVSNSTVIKTGDEIVYKINVSNTTSANMSSVQFSDPIPHNTRFNYTDVNNSSAGYLFEESQYRLTKTISTLTAGGTEETLVFRVESNDSACNVPIENTAKAVVSNKTYQVTRKAIAYDQLYTVYNMEAVSVSNNLFMSNTNFFTETSSERGWQLGNTFTPTFLGPASGSNIWGTNLSGPYFDNGESFKDQTLTGTLDLTGVPKGFPVYLVWQQYLNFQTPFNNAEVIIKDGTTSQSIYNSTTVLGNGVVDTNGWELQRINVQDYAGRQVLLIFRFTTQGNNANQSSFGWYVDDIALGACNVTGLTLNKVASTSPAACTTTSTGSASSKKESKRGLSGLQITRNTEVYYCFAVKNTGNVTLTNHTLYDNKLRDTEIITSQTATNFPSQLDLVDLQTNGLGPLAVTNTHDLLNGSITPTAVISQNTVNTATWSASILNTSYYDIMTSTGHSDKGFTSISSTGKALELKDDSELTVTTPFVFSLFGQQYLTHTKVVVANNGGILFGNTISDVAATNTPLPLTRTQGVDATQGQAIFPMWDDWGTGNVYSDVRGTSPSREWVIQWQVPHKSVGGTNNVVFQVIIYESSNNIVFVYNDVNVGNSTYNSGASATVGLSNRLTETRQYSFNKAELQDGLEIRFRNIIQATASEEVSIQHASVTMSATVSTNGSCSATNPSHVTLPVGQNVTLCYYLVNHGTVTMTNYSLTDTRPGYTQTNGSFTLPPSSTLLVSQTTFVANESMMINAGSTVVASNKYPYRTSKDTLNPITYDFQDIGRVASNGLPNANIGTRLTMDGGVVDNAEGNVTMPFDFMFYGKTSNKLRIGNNGGILFDASAGDVSPNNTKLSNFEHPFAIFPYWDTFEGDQGGVYYTTTGTAPNRMFIVQWDDIQHFEQSTDQGTFQAILYEGSNNIKFQYEDVNFGTNAPSSSNNEEFNYGASATIGLNHFGNSSNSLLGDAHEYSYNNLRQSSLLTNTTAQVTNSFAIHWYPMSTSASDKITVTVTYSPSIELTKTVGTQSGVCATTDQITVTAGTTVYYCYTVKNTGNTTLDNNILSDDKLGLTILFDASQLTLAPGEMADTVSLGTSNLQAVIMTDTMNTAAWIASSALGTAPTVTDTAKVNVLLPPTAVEVGELGVSRPIGLPLGSLVVGMLLLVAGGYIVHRRREQ